MPLRATDNPLVLPLLGLLLEQPRHQYALLTEVRDRYGLRVRTGSLYTLVGSLEEAGWIEQAERETEEEPGKPGGKAGGKSGGRAGGKPSPVVFRVTPTGRAEFRRRVIADLSDDDPAHTPRFVTALAYVGILDRSTAIATLSARVAMLEERAEEWQGSVETSGLAPIYMIEADFVASQARHDIAWLEDFIDRIGDPDYTWPTGDTGDNGPDQP